MDICSGLKFRFGAILTLASIGFLGLAGLPGTGQFAVTSAAVAAVPADDETPTQDIIHMRDGRRLTGRILSETGDRIVFQYVDQRLNIKSQLTLNKADILNIERDVPVEGAAPPTRADDEETEPEDLEAPEDMEPVSEQREERGLAEGDADDESLPSLYVIPMRGQMGTDIRLEVYTDIIDDIRERQPDTVVWVLDCTDVRDGILAPYMTNPHEHGVMLIDDYRVLVQTLHDELRGIRQVMWVKDAFGVSAVIALAWPEMYMAPDARLIGMHRFFQEHGGDQDIKAKMREAWIGIGNGFLSRGGRSLALGHGLMNPREVLSASWRGRDVIWRNDLDGEYIVNASRDYPAFFRAKTAEDLGISRGTVANLDDLALLLGFREYRTIQGPANETVEKYRRNWRREFQRVQKRFGDYSQHIGWASGPEAVTWLGRALQDLQYIAQAMRRYEAVQLRVRMMYGIDLVAMDLAVEQLRQQIAEIRRRGRGGGRGGRGGGRGGRG